MDPIHITGVVIETMHYLECIGTCVWADERMNTFGINVYVRHVQEEQVAAEGRY